MASEARMPGGLQLRHAGYLQAGQQAPAQIFGCA